jgi:hypothetical protein
VLTRNAALTAGVCSDDRTVDRKAFALHKSDVKAILDNALEEISKERRVAKPVVPMF